MRGLVNRLLDPAGLELRRVPRTRPVRPPAPIPAEVAAVQATIAELCPHSNYASHYRTFEYGNWAPFVPVLAAYGELRGAGRVLDVGCGYGTLLAFLSRRGWRVHGTDVLPRSTLLGEATAAEFGIEFRRSNIEREALPYEAATFDVVVLTQVIEHFHFQPLTALRRAWTVVRPGGVLLVSTPALGFGWTVEGYDVPFEEIPEAMPEVEIDASRHMKIYSVEEFRRLLDGLGGRPVVDLHMNRFSGNGTCVGAVWKVDRRTGTGE